MSKEMSNEILKYIKIKIQMIKMSITEVKESSSLQENKNDNRIS